MEVGETPRPISAHPPGVLFHHRKVGTDLRSQINLVDHQQIRAGDARPSLAGDLVARTDISTTNKAHEANELYVVDIV